MKKFMEYLKELFTVHGLLGLLLASAGIGYVLVGFDIIPDPIPFIGYADDALMVVIAVSLGTMIARQVLPGLGPKAKR